MITKLTNVNLIKGNLQANNKNEVFAELAKMLFENNRISSKEAFLTDIEAREALSITSMDGIAYPHAKSKAVIEPAIAVGVKREGIEYGDEEGVKPTVFFMIASPITVPTIIFIFFKNYSENLAKSLLKIFITQKTNFKFLIF